MTNLICAAPSSFKLNYNLTISVNFPSNFYYVIFVGKQCCQQVHVYYARDLSIVNQIIVLQLFWCMRHNKIILISSSSTFFKRTVN